MSEPLSTDVLAALGDLDTPTVCNALEVVAPERRGHGYTTVPFFCPRPELGPISSIMGEITFIAMTSHAAEGEGVSPMELRRLAETVVRRNLLSISGISQVVPIGGELRQLQVTVHPTNLAQNDVSLQEIVEAVARASRSPAAGFHVEGGQEYLVRGLGRARQPQDVAATVVRVADGVPLRVGDLADRASLEGKVEQLLFHHNALLRGLGADQVDGAEVLESLLEIAPRLLPYADNVWQRLATIRRAGRPGPVTAVPRVSPPACGAAMPAHRLPPAWRPGPAPAPLLDPTQGLTPGAR